MYSNEAAFSRALTSKLNTAGFNVVRIESHSTENGIPDMFVQGYGKDLWIELKNSNASHKQDSIKVAWRPGQQAWHWTYLTSHSGKKNVVTLISSRDGLFIIPMVCIYTGNIVNKPFFIKWDVFKHLTIEQLTRLLFIACECTRHSEKLKTYRDAVNQFFDTYYPNGDYDPDVYWDAAAEHCPHACGSIDDQLNCYYFNNMKFYLFLETI